MNFRRVLQCAAIGTAVLLPATASRAQQKFPLRQGEWIFTTPDPSNPNHPFTLNVCMNDVAWSRSISQSPSCTVSDLRVTSAGVTYNLDCNAKSMQMTVSGTWKFDGMEHIATKSITTMTIGGKATTSTSQGDFRWKNPSCSPDDANLHAKPSN
jgi:hypothetical protein